jgi:hypothetical protein
MKSDRFVIASVVFLAIGLYVTFGYCNGTAGIWAGWPLSALKLNICVTTNGPGALGGPVLVGLGALLLLWAFISAVGSQFRLLGSLGKKVETPVTPDPRESAPKNPAD